MEEAEEGEAEEEPWSMADMDLRRTMGDPCITVAGERGGGGERARGPGGRAGGKRRQVNEDHTCMELECAYLFLCHPNHPYGT